MAGPAAGWKGAIGGRSRRLSNRTIPKRGQVKLAIVAGLAHSFAAFFARAPVPRLTRATS